MSRARVERVLKHLTSLKDPEDSDTKVIRMKEAAGEALAESIKYYQQRRRRSEGQLQQCGSALPEDAVAGDIKLLQERIEKHVDRVLEVTASFVRHAGTTRNLKDTTSRGARRNSIGNA